MKSISWFVATFAATLQSCGSAPPDPQQQAAATAAAARPAAAPAEATSCACHHDDVSTVSSRVERVDVGRAPIRGAVSAPVTVVAFFDYECPYCARGERMLGELERRYPSVRVAFKQRPLPFHEHAALAARAALAADEQGRFAEYHARIFASQSALDRASLERYATELGLDLGRFREALDSPRVAARIDDDRTQADELGVAGTPTFFVNGRRVVGAQPLDQLTPLVEASLGPR